MAFPDAFALVRDVPGWLTADQARALHDAVTDRGPGARVVEIGSHHGRSTIVLAAAGARVVAVDPFPADWRYGAAGTEQACRTNLVRAGVADRVDLRVATSREVRRTWSAPADVVYVDGKHDYRTVRDDLRWADHLAPGGVLLVHDAFSSLGVTTALLRELWLGRRLRYVDRIGSLARLEPGCPTVADRARVLGELPWWVRNLVVKVLLRLRLYAVARLVGHAGADDPY
jgi:predicted O-methyltransferase YrrM